jgi:cyanate permease
MGEDVIVQGALHAGAVVAPVLVPANVTVHVEGVHVIALVPVFLMVMAKAAGLAEADVPPVSEIATTWREELVVAEPARPKMVAVTIPPTARTAAMMMNRSRL